MFGFFGIGPAELLFILIILAILVGGIAVMIRAMKS